MKNYLTVFQYNIGFDEKFVQKVFSLSIKNLLLHHPKRICPDGGIGRRAGLKHQWETVPVRLRLRVQKPSLRHVERAFCKQNLF